MKTTTFFSTLIALALMGTANLYAQYGLGTNAPNAQAALHIESTSHGVLIPNVALTNAGIFLGGVAATADHTSMLVYNTNTLSTTASGLSGAGFYYWSGGVGGSWVRLQSSSAGSIAPNTINPGTDGQVLTTTGTGTAATVIWKTPAASTMSHWNVQGSSPATPATSNTDNIYQDGNVAIGTATNPRTFTTTGARIVPVRESASSDSISWEPSDFCVNLTVEPGLFLLPHVNDVETGRIISISNNSGTAIQFDGTDVKRKPANFSWVSNGSGYIFINTGTQWSSLAARQ